MFAFVIAFIIDRLFGEPKYCHPLIMWGYWAVRIEAFCNHGKKWQGVIAWCLAVLLPLVIVAGVMIGIKNTHIPYIETAFSALCLYVAIGWKSLREHGMAVKNALGDIDEARHAVSRIVSRDTEAMDSTSIIKATIESLLENGADAIFAPLFWFLIAGPLGAVAYRLANTLDAMWGYRTPRFAAFGWYSAKVDDVFNWVPARLTALSYALLGCTKQSLNCWRNQAAHCASPNGGPVMCAGAGSLSIRLGGRAMYHGQWCDKPIMGAGQEPQGDDITAAITLIDRAVYGWLAVSLMLGVLLMRGIEFA